MALSRSLDAHLHQQLTQLELVEAFQGQEMRAVPALACMALAGLGFNMGALKRHEQALRERLVQLEADAEAALGSYIQLGSAQQVSHALYDTLGMRPA